MRNKNRQRNQMVFFHYYMAQSIGDWDLFDDVQKCRKIYILKKKK